MNRNSRGDARHTVDVVVRMHHRAQARIANGGLEREEERILQLARADVGRGVVQPALRQAVADHVLAGREDLLVPEPPASWRPRT